MWSLPLKIGVTSWMSFSLWSRDDTSHTDPETKKPLLRHWFKQLSSSAWFLEQVWTVAPNPHKSSTMACLKIEQGLAKIQTGKDQNIEFFMKKETNLNEKKNWPNSASSTGDESGHSFEGPSRGSIGSALFSFCHFCLFVLSCLISNSFSPKVKVFKSESAIKHFFNILIEVSFFWFYNIWFDLAIPTTSLLSILTPNTVHRIKYMLNSIFIFLINK